VKPVDGRLHHMTSSGTRVAIIGTGLIGGSLLRALATTGLPVSGYDADPATRAQVRRAGHEEPGHSAVSRSAALPQAPGQPRWHIADSLPGAVRDFGADLVVLAVPLPALPAVLDELDAIGYQGLLTDVTSVKGPVATLVARHPALRYVGGHPMAGREHAGFEASDPELFSGRPWALCLEPDTPLEEWLALADLLTTIGARVVPTTATAHDAAVARISHVPHLLATALARASTDPLAAGLAAGSFRDGTRVAASPPALVTAMCSGNAAAVREALDALVDDLRTARELLESPEEFTRWLEPGYAMRRSWPSQPGPESTLPATRTELLALGQAGGWITKVAADRRAVTAQRPAA